MNSRESSCATLVGVPRSENVQLRKPVFLKLSYSYSYSYSGAAGTRTRQGDGRIEYEHEYHFIAYEYESQTFLSGTLSSGGQMPMHIRLNMLCPANSFQLVTASNSLVAARRQAIAPDKAK